MGPQEGLGYGIVRWWAELGRDLLHVLGLREEAGTRHRPHRLRQTLDHFSDLAAEFAWRPPSTAARGVPVPQRRR